MTKCIVIGEQKNDKNIVPIEFNRVVNSQGGAPSYAMKVPSDYENIELISRNYSNSDYDLIFAYDTNRDRKGVLYLGKWNDGVV